MLQAYEGFLEENRFYPIGTPINIKGRKKVIVTVLGDEPIHTKEVSEASKAKVEKLSFSRSEIDEMMKGSITETLIGALHDTSKTLEDYNEERLSKYARID